MWQHLVSFNCIKQNVFDNIVCFQRGEVSDYKLEDLGQSGEHIEKHLIDIEWNYYLRKI